MTEGGLENIEGLSGLEKDFLSDYYWSFRHSQGSAGIQENLFEYLSWKYAKQNFQPGDRLLTVVNGMKIPTQHAEFLPNSKVKVEQKISDNLKRGGDEKDSWDVFLQTLEKTKETIRNNPKVEIEEQSKEEMIPEIFYDFIVRDIIYQGVEGAEGERKNRKKAADPHESFLKSYLLDGKYPETPQFKELYKKMKEVMEKVKNNQELNVTFPSLDALKDKLNYLTEKWEQNHPGKRFFE